MHKELWDSYMEIFINKLRSEVKAKYLTVMNSLTA